VRRLLPLLALALLAIGCGDERAGEVAEASGSFSAVPTTELTPTTAPAPTTATPGPPTGPLAGFPLDLGYEEENGDDHSPVEVTDQPGLLAFDLCGRPVWDPHAGTTDLIGVEFRGEAEWSRGRTLVLYPSEDDAADAVSNARDAVAGCPEEPAEEGYGTTHHLLDIPVGDQSAVWADTYWFTSKGQHLHDTGLTVYHLVRVGRAVLGSYEYGESNGSDESRKRAISEATDAGQAVVDAMGDL
jgi:hypothetical protein